MRRVLRETFADGWPAEMYGSEWSSWRPLLYPVQREVWFQRSAHVSRVPAVPAVYELGIVKSVEDAVASRECVYLGKTQNARRRTFSYAWRGSHLSPLLHRALLAGHRVDFRYMTVADAAKARTIETLVLARFDYAWNVELNGQVRPADGTQPQNLVVSRFFACPPPTAPASPSPTTSSGRESPPTATECHRTSCVHGSSLPSRCANCRSGVL